MRVLLACPSYPPQDVTCGVGDYTRCLAEALARQGDQVTVLTSAAYRGPTTGGVLVLPLLDRRDARWWSVAGAQVINVQYTPDLYRSRPRIVGSPALARVSPGAPPIVVTFHTLVDGTLRSKSVVPWLLLTAAHCISASEEVTGLVDRHLPWLRRHVTEIPIGSNVTPVPVPDRAAERARWSLPADGPLLVHFGLVYPGKGLETLLEALAIVRRRGVVAHLAVAGDTREDQRPYRAALEARASRLGVTGAVTWTGRRSAEEVSRLLGIADVYVVPYDDGASIRRGSLMAGLAHRLPVVSTRSPVVSQYLRDGDNVALVAPRDAGALASTLLAVLHTPAERARLARGAAAVAERLAWPAIARATREVYARAAGR